MTVSIANVSIAQRVNRKAVAIMSLDIRIGIHNPWVGPAQDVDSPI